MWEYVILIVCAVYVAAFFDFIRRWNSLRDRKQLEHANRVLFVIAHPDDECMFFSPTIIQLCLEKKDVYLLCLTIGNRYGLGNIRKNELRNSCHILGVDVSNIVIINHTNLPDDNSAVWNRGLVARIIQKYVEAWDIDTLITFDQRGVSGHRNHRALHSAACVLATRARLPPACRLFVLTDVCLLRKYIGIFDVPLTLFFAKYAYISSYKGIGIGKKAMAAHQSQFVWFRRLYICFSRYMIINDLQPFDEEDGDEMTEF